MISLKAQESTVVSKTLYYELQNSPIHTKYHCIIPSKCENKYVVSFSTNRDSKIGNNIKKFVISPNLKRMPSASSIPNVWIKTPLKIYLVTKNESMENALMKF